MQFGGVYVYTFQPGNVTGWGSERVNMMSVPKAIVLDDHRSGI